MLLVLRAYWQWQGVDNCQIDIDNGCKLEEGSRVTPSNISSCCHYCKRPRNCILGLLEVCHH